MPFIHHLLVLIINKGELVLKVEKSQLLIRNILVENQVAILKMSALFISNHQNQNITLYFEAENEILRLIFHCLPYEFFLKTCRYTNLNYL